MAYYPVHGLIPDGISQSEGYKMFEQYIASGAPMDNFEGFELVSRFHAPETGEVFVTFKADNHLAISQHFGVWRACLLYTSPSPRDLRRSRMPSSA